jgi:two-component system, LytTR family, response regulator
MNNNSIKALIVEDEHMGVVTLKSLILDSPFNIQVLHTSPSVADALVAIPEHKPELVFLDIELQDGTSFSLLEQLQEINFKVIFTTAFDQYGIRAVKCSAIDYLLKPIAQEDFNAALKKYLESSGNMEESQKLIDNLVHNYQTPMAQKIAIHSLTGFDFYEINSIVELSAKGTYTEIVFANKQHVTSSKPIGYYENLLENTIFFRVHNSNIINLNHLTGYIHGRCGIAKLSNGSAVTVSARRTPEFKELIKNRI